MRKPYNFTVTEVLDNAELNLTLEFYTSKDIKFIGKDISDILGKQVTATTNESFNPTWTSSILLQEYEAKRSKYSLKIGPQKYKDINPNLRFLLMWINENATLDQFSKLKVKLNFDFNNLRTIKTISNMDIGKMILKIDEKYIYEKFNQTINNPYTFSVKKITPLSNFINTSSIIYKMSNIFNLPINEYYGIDFTNYHNGDLIFNYISGNNYSDKPDEIIEILEYYIIITYQTLNEIDYSEFEERELKKLTKNYLFLKNLYFNSDKFLKEYKDIKVMINLDRNPLIIKSRWAEIRNPLFNIIFETNFKEGKFNWDTEEGTFQIKDTKLEGAILKNFDLINCELHNCILEKIHFWGSKISNSIISNSTLVIRNKVKNSALNLVRADRNNFIEKSNIKNNGEIINCEINESVIRNAELGKNAKLDENSTLIEKKEFSPQITKGIDIEEIRDYRWIKDLTERIEDGTKFGNEYKTDY